MAIIRFLFGPAWFQIRLLFAEWLMEMIFKIMPVGSEMALYLQAFEYYSRNVAIIRTATISSTAISQ